MADYRFRLLAGTALALAGAAFAPAALADTSLGWYAAVDAGHGPITAQTLTVSDVTLQSPSTGATPPLTDGSYKLSPDYDARGFARVGYRFTPNLRAELELGARPGQLTTGLGGGTDIVTLGKVDKTSLMANLIFDIRPSSGIHPFVGIGAGVVQAKTDYHETIATTGHSVVYSIVSDKTVPAGQILAGATLDVTQHLHFDMTYRYLRTGSTSYDVAVSDTHGSDIDTYLAKADGPIEDHSLTVGFRWTFGAPAKTAPRLASAPPAPTLAEMQPVAPAGNSAALGATAPGVPGAGTVATDQPLAPARPATTAAAAPSPPRRTASADGAGSGPMTAVKPRQFTAYFPFGGWHLDSRSQSAVVEAAQYAQSAPEARVKVDGYADTSGSSAYNMALSRRRATAVAQDLTDHGVPTEAITVAWHGESHPAVRTGDGVASARNRRVVIGVQLEDGQ